MYQNWKRNITLFLSGQTVSILGSMIVQYAITWYIATVTNSGLMMMIGIICGFLPTFFLSPFAGVWADRYNKKTLIILSDGMTAFSTLILAIIYFLGYREIWLIFVIMAIRAVGSGIQGPAVNSLVPHLVPQESLPKINSITSTIQSVIAVAAPFVSGVLRVLVPMEAIFMIDVVTAAIAISILFWFLHIRITSEKKQANYLNDMKEGFHYIKDHRYIMLFCVFDVFFLFLIAPAAFLTQVQVNRSFGLEPWRLPAMEMAFSSGMVLGGIIIGLWGGFKNKLHTMVLSNLFCGLCTAALGIVPEFWSYLGVMFIFGISLPVFNVPSTVLLQQRVDKNFLGRVFGVFSMITSTMMPLGMLVFGPLADYIRIEWILIVTGLCILVLTYFMGINHTLIEAGKPVPVLQNDAK